MSSDNKTLDELHNYSPSTKRFVRSLGAVFLVICLVITVSAVKIAKNEDEEASSSSSSSKPADAAPNATESETNVTIASTPEGADAGSSVPSLFMTLEELANAVDDYLLNQGPSSLTEGYGASIGVWDVSNVENFTSVFSSSRNLKASSFNEDISGWNVAKAKDMTSMFEGADAFEGTGLGSWNVSSVTEMDFMFKGTAVFNTDLSAWNVANVMKFDGMFAETEKFDGTGLSGWPVSDAATTSSMFCNANGMNPFALPAWVDDTTISCESK